MNFFGRFAVVAVLSGALISCRGGCRRDVAPPAQGLLASLPAGTRFVLSADVAAIRASALWAGLSALAKDRAGDRAIVEQFTARTGVDPFRHIHRIVAAFPEEARQSGQFALVIDGEGFDEKRLVSYARDQAKLRGQDIQSRVVASRTVWVGPGPERTGGFFMGAPRFVLGAGGWAEELAAIAGGTPGVASAADNNDLSHLCARVDSSRAFWFAAVVPAQTRRMLQADVRFSAAASVARLGGTIDFERGLAADLLAELSNEADARTLAARVLAFKRDAKGSPQVLMLGLAAYVDAVSASSDGPNVHIRIALTEGQVNDLMARVGGLARMQRK